MPKISVIIPTYNRAAFMAHAIDSVLAQTYQDFEIIVVDDGSIDNTLEVLNKYSGRIRVICQEHSGIAQARNAAIHTSQGAYIAFLDSDDYWVPEKLELQVKVLDSQAAVGLVYARMPIINDEGQIIGMKPAGKSGRKFKELLYIWGDLPTSSVMVRRQCFEKAGLFDPSLPTMEDIDMWIRIARYFDLYEIKNRPLAYYRRHQAQATRHAAKVYEGLFKIYTKIYNAYPDGPRALMARRMVENRYLLAKALFLEGSYKNALKNAWGALTQCPYLGFLFVTNKDSLKERLTKPLNPYGLLVASFFKLVYENLH